MMAEKQIWALEEILLTNVWENHQFMWWYHVVYCVCLGLINTWYQELVSCVPPSSPLYLSVHDVSLFYRECLSSLWLCSVLWNLSLIPPPNWPCFICNIFICSCVKPSLYTYKIMWRAAWKLQPARLLGGALRSMFPW